MSFFNEVPRARLPYRSPREAAMPPSPGSAEEVLASDKAGQQPARPPVDRRNLRRDIGPISVPFATDIGTNLI